MARCHAHAALAVTAALLAPLAVHGEPPPDRGPAAILGHGVPPEISALLRKTRDAYGADAVALEVELLQRAVQADSILPAGVRVRGVEARGAYRYLVFHVETGIVFNSERTDGDRRLEQLWSDIVLPVLERVSAYEVPGDGIALELSYSYRPYSTLAALTESVSQDPGRPESAALYLLRRDVLAFRQRKIGARELRERADAQVGGSPAAPPFPTTP